MTASTTTGVGEPRPLPAPPLLRQPGLVRRMFVDPRPVLDELSAVYGPIVGLGAGPVRMAVIGDPTALRELFSMPTTSFRWGHRFNVLGFVVGKGSMIVSDGPDHKRRRSSVQAAFARRRLNRWIPRIVECTDQAIDRLAASTGGRSTVVDLAPVSRSLVLEIVVGSLFGDRMAGRTEEIGELFRRPQAYLESSGIRQIPHPFPGTARSRVKQDRARLDAIIDAEIADRRANPADDPDDVLQVLVDDGDLSDAEIRDQVVTLIGAGYDTTSATLAWTWWCTALCPGLWERLRAEADEVLGPLGGDAPRPDDATLSRLELAHRVMLETTRLHPAGAIAPREAVEDIAVGGYRIRAGTLVLWSAHLAGRDPSAWPPDPLRFDPDRHLDPPEGSAELAQIAWVPFGRGARNCIGFALAQMELVLILSRFAQRLDVDAVSTQLPKAVGMVVNRPAGGAPMRVSVRTTT